jgi:UDP-glucose 4-epimerase
VRSPAAASLVEASGIDVLVHLAAQMELRRSVEEPLFDAEINVMGSLNLLEAARRGGVRQVVFASTGGAIYGESDELPAAEDAPPRPLSPYGVAKLAVEHYLYAYHAAHGLGAHCLRYANVYGERQSPHGEAGVVAIFLDRLLAGRQPVINGDGLQTRDYVHVADVVRANVAAVGRPGFAIYNVGTGVETTVVELYERLRRALGSRLAARHGEPKKGEQRRSAVDPRRLLAELSLPPPLPLDEGLARTAAWFRARSSRQPGLP